MALKSANAPARTRESASETCHDNCAELLLFAATLTAAAVVGKQACSLGVVDRGARRLAVGLGMIPRGEVGLIFAGIGAGLVLAGEPVIDSDVYAAIVLMVGVTTLVTPPLLQRSLRAKHDEP